MIIFFWINAQNIYLNYIVYVFIIIILFWGVEVAPAYHEVIKKLKMNHLWLYMLHDISHSMPQRLQNVIKNKWGMPVTEVLNTCTRKSNKHLLKISCKNKVLIKSFSLWNWIGTNFWDTLYIYDAPDKVFNAVCDLIQIPSRLRSQKTRYIATDHDDANITFGFPVVFWAPGKIHWLRRNPRQSWILDCAPWIPDSRYFVSGFWVPIVSGIRDSFRCIPESKAQYSGYHKYKYPGFRISQAKLPGFRNTYSLTWGEGNFSSPIHS